MFNSTTLAKLAVVVVSLGGIAGGGGYIFKDQLINGIQKLRGIETNYKPTWIISSSNESLTFLNKEGKDESLKGEYVFFFEKSSSNSEVEKSCVKIERGIGTIQNKENCDSMASSNSLIKDGKNTKVWIKAKDKTSVRKIFEALSLTSTDKKWFEGDNKTLESNFLFKPLTCNLEEKSTFWDREVSVNCSPKTISN
ncbi:hypothetical protein [Mycoplasma suis]|uniref:Uncharacterized protein n=1 Tax=Mycoplasma suis (strain Illinois) TaxID=768700 RepID=F0QQ81_MYCSL|nr:hypothetical protein [Mycoplasma suis]ADX97651.1 hypothetical protein MSU_0107 [Mycoplasma suis str. Illinois]